MCDDAPERVGPIPTPDVCANCRFWRPRDEWDRDPYDHDEDGKPIYEELASPCGVRPPTEWVIPQGMLLAEAPHTLSTDWCQFHEKLNDDEPLVQDSRTPALVPKPHKMCACGRTTDEVLDNFLDALLQAANRRAHTPTEWEGGNAQAESRQPDEDVTSLVERVAMAIRNSWSIMAEEVEEQDLSDARAAIREVADWMCDMGELTDDVGRDLNYAVADWLRSHLED